MIDVNGVDHFEPHMPVNAGAGVPSSAGFFGMIYTHGDNVGVLFQVRRQIVTERRVAVVPTSKVMTIDPDVAVHVNAIEINKYFTTFP
jgi:hypothetical protein